MVKVAVYCRVSTEKDAQINSLANQKLFFGQYIEKMPDWHLYRMYVDEGITGTSVQKRQGFLQMLADAQRKRFALILTKEISRFARNTLDSIYYTRKLKDWGIGVIFLNDNINTLDADAELRLTIMASIAQEESRKTSERVKWGQKRQMERGTVFGHSLFGYTLEKGQLKIEEEKAEIVREIFQQFVGEEKGAYTIARELTQRQIPTPSGKDTWSHSVILKILKNEKYAGNLVQKKTYTPDYLTHKKKQNRGQEPLVVVSNHHPPLISSEIFARAQQLLAARRKKQQVEKSRYSQVYCFSGKLTCGCCGKNFVARKKKKGEKTYLYWQCSSRGQNTAIPGEKLCPAPILSQNFLEQVLTGAVTFLVEQGLFRSLTKNSRFYDCLAQTMGVVAAEKNRQNRAAAFLAQLEKEAAKLLPLYLKDFLTEEEFAQQKKIYGEKIQMAKEEIAAAATEEKVSVPARMEQIQAYCRQILTGEIFAAPFYRAVLQQVRVIEKGHLVLLWQGLPLEVAYREE